MLLRPVVVATVVDGNGSNRAHVVEDAVATGGVCDVGNWGCEGSGEGRGGGDSEGGVDEVGVRETVPPYN